MENDFKSLKNKMIDSLRNPDIRSWIFYKMLNPRDTAIKKIGLKKKYIDSYQFEDILKLPPVECHMSLFPWEKKSYKKNSTTEMHHFKLAGQTVKIFENDFEKFFQKTYPDPEDTEAVHRFSYLLTHLNQDQYALDPDFILLWIKSHQFSSNSWSSYTISERLSHWGMYHYLINIFSNWDDQKKAIFYESVKKQVHFLWNHLEYQGDFLTCNHLSNNGRGILWGGFLLGNRKLISYGLRIMIREGDRLFQDEGTLREGSTHYQYLIARNYLEATAFAKSFDFQKESNRLKIYTQKLIDVCKFFSLQENFCYIGDLSPDYSQNWFRHIPHLWTYFNDEEKNKIISNPSQGIPATGYAAIFMDYVHPVDSDRYHKIQDDYARIDDGDYSLIVHGNPLGYPELAGHGHIDSGSPVVVYKGKELLIDLGRPSYTKDDHIFKMAAAHNSLIINDLGPELFPRGIFGLNFLSKRSGDPPQFKLEDHKLIFHHFGYQRFGYHFIREYKISQEELMLGYYVKGQGHVTLGLYLHAPKARSIKILWPKEGEVQKKDGKRALDYGVQEDVVTYEWIIKKVLLPYQINITIHPLDD